MKVSVIICSFNRAKLLGESLRSVQCQDFDSHQFEIIAVDNNSTDETKAMIEKMAVSSPVSVKYVFESRQGLSYARNTGINYADGEIIVFTDDDVAVDKSWLRNLIAAFDGPDVYGAGGPIRPIWPHEKPEWLTEDLEKYLAVNEFQDVHEGGDVFIGHQCPWGANMAFRREVFTDIGLFPTDLGRIGNLLLSNEEVQLCSKIKESGRHIRFAPDAIVHHKISPERLRKIWFYHRIYWQGRSDAVIESSKNDYLYKRLFDSASASAWTALTKKDEFESKCWNRYAKGYLHQLALSQKDRGDADGFKKLRVIESFLKGLVRTSANIISEKENVIRDKEKYIEAKDEQIQRMINSKSWRLTAPLRKIEDYLRRYI